MQIQFIPLHRAAIGRVAALSQVSDIFSLNVSEIADTFLSNKPQREREWRKTPSFGNTIK